MTDTTVATAPPAASFTCQNCGATTNVAASRAIRCPFCGSEQVIARPDDPLVAQPEAIVPFQVEAASADEIYRTWLGTGFFRPKDLTQASTDHKMRAVFLPFWECRAEAHSRWAATSGIDHQRSEEYTTTENGQTVTKTRTVTETRWRPAQGEHRETYPRELISASKGLAQEWVGRLGDYEFGQLQTYRPEFLLGRESEEAALDEAAARQAAARQIEAKERSACAGLVPGDRHKDLRVETTLSGETARLLFLPVWIASFQYDGKLYRCVVNGQTGKIGGEAPVSKGRVALVIGGVVAVIVVIVLLIVLLG
jgi:DNA-directed RNA polymerase subunit RPC12/RpoP